MDDLVKRLRQSISGKMTSMADGVLQVTIGLPPCLEAADRLERISAAWADASAAVEAKRTPSEINTAMDRLAAAIEGTDA